MIILDVWSGRHSKLISYKRRKGGSLLLSRNADTESGQSSPHPCYWSFDLQCQKGNLMVSFAASKSVLMAPWSSFKKLYLKKLFLTFSILKTFPAKCSTVALICVQADCSFLRHIVRRYRPCTVSQADLELGQVCMQLP